MKTYILRNGSKVQPQRHLPPITTASALLGVPVSGTADPILFIGLDVHTDSIAVSLAPATSVEVRRYGLIGGAQDDVLRLAKKLQAAHPHTQLRFCYQAEPHSYPLCRFLRAHGYECRVVVPSKGRANRANGSRPTAATPINWPGSIAGELTAIYMPDPQDEAVRDLIRARHQVQRQQHRARQ